MENWTTAAEFNNEPDAYIAAGMLKDNGIEAVVGASNMTTLYGGGSTWAPVTISVRKADLARAQELLAAHHDG